MPLAPGETIAGYTVVRQIGSGGMGSVYLVRHPRLPRMDALKLLKPEFSIDPDFSRRFLREADVVAGLSHRNIVAVLDRGEDRGQLWLTMQYIEGIDAEQALEDAGGILPAERVARIITEVAAALDAAHRHHLIHRDVKPANILLSPSNDDDEPEQVFLTDFGIAKSTLGGSPRLTRTGAVLATFDYASPEQIESRSPDGRSDIYSLACVLYKLLTGSVPYPGPGVAAAIHGHLQLPPPRPTARVPWLAPGIDDVVARAMNKDPAERYQTCRALAAAAAAALTDFPAPPSPPYTVQLTGPTGAVLGPMTTERLSRQETEQLVELVRRTRFFDLPENLHEVSGRTTTGHRPRGGRPVTLEIRAGRSVRRVMADLDEARRPATLDALVAAVEKLPPPPDQAPAPATRLNDLRAAQAAIAARAAQAAPPAATPPPPGATRRPPARDSAPPVRQQTPQQYSGQQSPQPAYPVAPTGPPGPYGGSSSRYGTGGPYGLAGPNTPWTPVAATEPEREGRRALWVLVALVVLAAAGVLIWMLTRGQDDPPGGEGSGSSSDADSSSAASASEVPAPAPEAQAAYDNLPRTSATLGEQTLIAPRLVEGNLDLYVLDADGALGARLTTGPQRDVGPLISADRRTLIYTRQAADVDEDRELWTMSAAGEGDRPLFDPPLTGCAEPGRPAWNPADQTQLAIVCYGEPTLTLRIISLEGAIVHELTPARAYIDDLAFSPDGTEITYWAADSADAGQGRLYAQSADGSSEPRALSDGEGDNDPAWSPDGSTIAFSRGVGAGLREIYVVPAAGGEARSLLAAEGSAANGPAWSPDGSLIAFKSDRSGGDVPGWQWWIMGDDGSDPRQVTSEGQAVATPAWGPR